MTSLFVFANETFVARRYRRYYPVCVRHNIVLLVFDVERGSGN